MSHFAVLVVLPGSTPLEREAIQEALEPAMQPFHEFECTGDDDKYVQSIDITERVRRGYEQEKHNYEGIVDFAKGWEGLESLAHDAEPVLEAEHKYGWVRVNEKGDEIIEAIDRTNPNKKWDYWTIGGRWTGLLAVPTGASFSRCGHHWSFDPASPDPYACDTPGFMLCDAAKKGDVAKAIPVLQEYRAEQARKRWAAAQGDDPMLRALKYGVLKEDTEESLVENAMTENPFRTYAVLMDGNWYARGRMGWFGCSIGDVGGNEWSGNFDSLWDMIPDDAIITVVDCHI